MACGCRRPQARAAAAATAFPALLLALPLLALLGFPCARACTSVIVGPGATVDGDIFIARSDDGEDTTTSNNVSVYPARNGPAVFKANGNNFNIKLPGPGLTYLALPIISADPSQGRNASSEASGINSAGVAISATESIYNSKAALAADPYVGDTGMVEDAIPSVLLPQARSAREAMEILGRIVEEKGAGEGFGVLAADYEEAWYIETAGGHHWMALRVPHDSFFVSANQGRFQEANLSDAANVLHSPGLEKFAIRAGLYNPAQGHPLNFFDAFMDNGRAQATYSYPRVRELQQRFGGKAAGTQLSPHRPVFMPASHKVSLAEVQASLRNHFDGSEHDAYRRRDPQEPFRPVAVLRSGNGHVSQLRPALAGGQLDALSAINWVAWAMPALSPFVPLYKGLTHDMLPKELTSTAVEPDDVSLFWKARRLQALVFQDWPKLAPNATAAILAWEHDVQARQQPRFERRYAASGRGSGRAAARLLAAYTRRVVRQAADLLEQLTAQAAEHLGLPGVPDDAEVQHLLDVALSTYGFMPPEDKDKDLQARVSRPRVAALSKFLGAAPAVASA